jgi:hypothetical protein
VDDIKRKPYDLLDYAKNTFDRDFLEFNVNIHDLDSQMQAGPPSRRPPTYVLPPRPGWSRQRVPSRRPTRPSCSSHLHLLY